MSARHLLISGGVQGVGFRFAMCEAAADLGVRGWVRNRRDGRVEAVIDGPAHAVAAMLAWAQRGPPAARVDHVALRAATAEEIARISADAFAPLADG
jgi:acylphosphatase